VLTLLLVSLRFLGDYLHTDQQVLTQERVAKVALMTPPPDVTERRKEAAARELAEQARLL
jgi:hypothetical protein